MENMTDKQMMDLFEIIVGIVVLFVCYKIGRPLTKLPLEAWDGKVALKALMLSLIMCGTAFWLLFAK